MSWLTDLKRFMKKYESEQGCQQETSQPVQPATAPAVTTGSVNGDGSALQGADGGGPSGSTQETEAKPNHSTPQNLNEFEKLAFEKLASKAKAKNCLKRPAAAKPSSSSVAAPKPQAKPKVTCKKWKPASGVFGCIRCRGNVKGCEACWSPFFTGQRFSSRQEWQDGRARKTTRRREQILSWGCNSQNWHCLGSWGSISISCLSK